MYVCVILALSREFIIHHDRRLERKRKREREKGEKMRKRKERTRQDAGEAKRARARTLMLRTFDLSIYTADNHALSLMCALPMATRDLFLAPGLQLRPEAV